VSVSKHQIQAASRWLNDLADLTAGSQPLSEAKTKLAAMTPALAEEFDASAFNRNSLLFVARRCKFFPSFSEAYEALTEWRHDHPAPSHRSAIAGPESANETARLEAERAEAEASWRNISEPQIFAKVRAINEIKSPTVRLINGQFLATAVRRYAPRMLGLLPPEFLTANDDRSAA
jgi:hypothetical protein